MSILISASTLPPKLEALSNYIEELDKTSVDYIHCDVMDGKFVENKTLNYKVVKQIKTLTQKKLDVHLMVNNPSKVIKKYIKSGADIVSVHYEAYKNKHKLVNDLFKIKKNGAFSGLAINPQTPIEDILPYVYFCDMLLIMSVSAGAGGQKFLEQTFDRLEKVNNYLKTQELDITIEVDGGINKDNLLKLKKKNVDIVVIGSYFYTSSNLKKTVEEIKTL